MNDDEKSKAIARYTKIARLHMDKACGNAFKSPEEEQASQSNVIAEKATLMAILKG